MNLGFRIPSIPSVTSWLPGGDSINQQVARPVAEFSRLWRHPLRSYNSIIAAKWVGRNQRNGVRIGLGAATGGAMGQLYAYGKNKGMSDGEAARLGLTTGLQYGEARTDMAARIAEGESQAAEAVYQKQVAAEATRARLQNEVRVRRTRLSERPSNKNGTLLTGALGLPGTGRGKYLLGG